MYETGMMKYKISSLEIEQLFKFMNLFEFNEIIKHKYFLENKEGTELHVLVFNIGAMTPRSFNSRAKRFKQMLGDALLIERLDRTNFYPDHYVKAGGKDYF